MSENNNEKENKQPGWRENLNKHMDLAIIAFLVIAACILFYFVLFKFAKISEVVSTVVRVISPIIVGFIFAYVLNPMVMFLEKHLINLTDRYSAYSARKKEEKAKNSKAEGKKEEPAKPSKTKAIAKMLLNNDECDDRPDVTNQNTALVGKRKAIRRISIAVTEVTALGLVILIVSQVIPAFTTSLASLAEKFPGYFNKISSEVIKFVDNHEWIKKQIPDANEIINKFDYSTIVSDYLNSILSTAYNWVIVAFRIVYNVVIGLIISMYLLGGKERYIGQLKKLSFAIMKPDHSKRFIQRMSSVNRIFKSAILGKMLDSIIIGCLCFIGMSVIGLFGFDVIYLNRVLISVIVGVTNVVPFFGPYIGGIPSVILLMCENPIDGLVFAIFIVILQQFDCNFLDPRIVGRSVGLSPIYVLSACLTCGGLFGIAGMLIASPTCAVIYGLIKTWAEGRLEDNNLPVDTKEYSTTPGATILKDSREENA